LGGHNASTTAFSLREHRVTSTIGVEGAVTIKKEYIKHKRIAVLEYNVYNVKTNKTNSVSNILLHIVPISLDLLQGTLIPNIVMHV